MQLELLILPVTAVAAVLWLGGLAAHPRWLLLLGAVGLTGLVALVPVWLQPVGVDHPADCGSVLRPRRPSWDNNGDCDAVRADHYNPTVSFFVLAQCLVVAAGATSLVRLVRRSGRRRAADGAPS